MSELKTLKDIDWIQKDMNNVVVATNTYKLRKEAIKYVKELNNKWGKHINKVQITNKEIYLMNNCKAIIDWIKHFFNITEEELE